MDLGTIIGLAVGGAMIVMSILTSGGNLGNYVHVPSIFMVIGGSFAAVLVTSPISRVLGVMRYVNIILRVPVHEEERVVLWSVIGVMPGLARTQSVKDILHRPVDKQLHGLGA